MFNFEKLNTYQKARILVKVVYELMEKFPQKEEFALKSQLRRAVVSIPSNIAEGMGRISNKEKVHFIEIAYGSLMETDCQFEIAKDLNYISNDEYALMYKKIHTLAKIITGLKSRRLSNSVASIIQ